MKLLFTVLFLLLSLLVKAQIGSTTLSFSYGKGQGQRKPIAAKAELLGFSSKGSIKTFDVGASHMLGKHTSLETGVTILNHRYQYTLYDKPGRTSVAKAANTLVIPIKLKVNILKYFFISGGFLLNSSLRSNDSNGLDVGFGIGAGVQYYFQNKYGIFIYPQTNVHTLTIGLSEQHIAAGLAYRFQKN